jgi:hypothetical protein
MPWSGLTAGVSVWGFSAHMVTHGVLVIVKDWHGQPCDAVDKRDASKCKR